ncbi:IPT/TIG domain-containing protein [Polymorphospora sp. 2-325]|uniref:IPT/TIG domain-containing protein n=1 Tax=Polymorphospora lycopeni TaxID=3140240 RepID=A0ABV5D100_9ACTN
MYVIDTATNAVVSWYPLNGVLPSTIAAFPWSAPVVTGVEPSSGPVTGGNTVTVTGNRLNKATITFGAAGPASGVSCTTTSCSATAPPGPLGVVDLQLSTPGGTVAAGQYTHLPVPVVTSVSPSSGPVAGGTTVTITGTDLEDATEVTFGPGRRATDLVCTATSCSVTAPAGPAGTVHVQVISPTGTSATNDADRYTYLPPPVVTAIHPDRGPTTGGTTVTITGTNLADATAITFGPGNTATDVSCTATSCTAVAPPGTGTVQVRVTTAGGTSGSAQYTYNDSPVVTAVSPNAGPAAGGNTVTITGTNLAGATGITFGSGNNATDVSCTAILCTAVAPAGNAGDVHVQVTTPGGTSATSDADRYTYVSAPTVTAVSPNTGPLAGGNTVTITGTDLAGASITFGSGTNATDVSCTATSCTAVAPPGNAGDVHVQATTIGGTSATSVDNQYTYVPVPTVTAVTPDAGPTAGGNTVTITGTDLAGATAVTFGSGNNGTDVSCTATLCTAVAPAGSAGEVHVQVTTPGGTSATSDADRYTYVSAPTVTAVSPNAGPLAGGNTVTITGTDLAGATITFGSGNNATDVSCTATSCTAVAPTGNAGDVHVQATTIGGTSATSVDNQYTYVPVPTVTAVTPDAGPTAGGNTVTITGTDLAGATAVTFGSGNNGTDVSCTATLCTAVAPAGSAGEVHVQVTTPGGTSATSDADRYTYVSAPTVTAVSPNAGPLAGGNTVTITGTDLAGATITFGSGNNAHRRVLHHHLLHRCRSDRKRWRRSRASHHARRNQRHQRRQPVHLRAGACGDRDPPRRWPRSRR